MPTFTKTYDVECYETCAVNCPFMTITTSEEESDEVVLAHCERYRKNLFKTPDGEKLLRAKNCTLIKVEWVFEFGEKNESENKQQ